MAMLPLPTAAVPSPLAAFTVFDKLPREIRLMVWERVLPGPRIVHIVPTTLRTDDDAEWWNHVRSDKRIEGPAVLPPSTLIDNSDSEYDDCDISIREIERMELDMATQRLLTRENEYNGTVTRADALQIINQYDRDYRNIVRRFSQTPSRLFGFRPDAGIPTQLFFVCREAYEVASKVYCRTFSALGALPATHFNYKDDTLYISSKFCRHESLYGRYGPRLRRLSHILRNEIVPDEFARVENLAVQFPHLYTYSVEWGDRFDRPEVTRKSKEWLFLLAEVFPNLKRLIAVRGEYGIMPKPSSTFLKLMNFSTDADGVNRVDGYRLDPSLTYQPTPLKVTFHEKILDDIREDWAKKYPNRPWCFPDFEYKVITSATAEQYLLKAAARVAKEKKNGCWWINPLDPTDFEETPGDELDPDIEHLLDWY